MKLSGLSWDEFNTEHIKKHGVTKEEVEEACENKIDVLESYGKRKMLFGKTNQGRYLTIILSKSGRSVDYPVTARDTSRKERRYVYEKEK